jgi:hypothetical protein
MPKVFCEDFSALKIENFRMEGAEGHMEALESCSFFAFKTCAQD